MKPSEGILSVVVLIAAYLWMTDQADDVVHMVDVGDILLHVTVYCAGAVVVVIALILLIVFARRARKSRQPSRTP